MKISMKYWRTARAMAAYYYGDPDIADLVLECANGGSYEPDDDEIAENFEFVQNGEPRELPDYVESES